MDALDRWFWDAASTPTGSIVLFLLVFLARVSLDQFTQRRARRKARKHPKIAHGA